MNPILGIVTSGISDNKHLVPNTYLDAARHCGFTPLILPFTRNHHDMLSYTYLCHSFLFCGGGDINPLFYGKHLTDNSSTIDSYMDQFHITFMKIALSTKKPLVAICRGMQVLNVALGGTLLQDISKDYIPWTQNFSPQLTHPLNSIPIQHTQNTKLRSEHTHQVFLSPESHLFQLLGTSTYTNSYHHQAIETLGSGLRISGHCIDGIIEAIEVIDHPFAIGVQWHPECLLIH